MKLLPLFDNLLVQKLASQQQWGGIIVPETGKTETAIGRVLGFGDDCGKMFRRNQEVLFKESKAFTVRYDAQEYLFLNQKDILAVVAE